MNLWLLTEERPKASVVKDILNEYCAEFGGELRISSEVKIKPVFTNGAFIFNYTVENVSITGIDKITIKIVSGNSSFIDYILIKQIAEPVDHSIDNAIMAIEETKTSDEESRNTGIYQRASKFSFVDNYCPNIKKYMLYNQEKVSTKSATETNIFGSRLLLTLGVKILGKSMNELLPFINIDELIAVKATMRLPNHTNIPILIEKHSDMITISGRLAKPRDAGNIGHDPNIGSLSCIAASLRKLGWTKDIVITRHGVSQEYVTKTRGNNKFLYLCSMIGMKLDGITMPATTTFPEHYWNYCYTSEKVASILLHTVAQYNNIHGIYENHAGCERGYFKTLTGECLTIPKKDAGKTDNLLIPDLILFNDTANEILLIEGKQLTTLAAGVLEIETYHAIESEFIKLYYPTAQSTRWLTIFGGEMTTLPHPKILLYLSKTGVAIINSSAPEYIKAAFRIFGVSC